MNNFCAVCLQPLTKERILDQELLCVWCELKWWGEVKEIYNKKLAGATCISRSLIKPR